MRNLHCCQDRRQQLPLPVELGDVTHFAVDSDGGVLFVAGSGLGVAAYRTADCEMLWCVDLRASLEASGSAAPPTGAAIAACDWVPELDALCLALSSGELLLLDAEQQAAGARAGAAAAAVEEVGAVDGGLAAAAWSPDGELLVLVTGTAQLLLMNKNWELLAEVPLLQHKEGAASAGSTAPDTAPKQPAQLAPGSVGITWRGDGRFFATSSLDSPGAATATLRVWERDTAELHSQGQPESLATALLPATAWQPNGRHLYVAAARRQEGGQVAAAPEAVLTADEAEQARQAAAEGIAHVGAWKRELRRRQQARAAATGAAAPEASVLLFERNGLQHGSFELPPAGLEGCAIEQLAWSPDSEFLAVVLSEVDEDGLPQQVLQLWHRSNWHWYCKAERRLRCCAVLHAAWDAAASGSDLLLHLMTAEGDYQQLRFSRQPTVSARGTAVVVDGSSLLITPLRHTVVPPPMCSVAVSLPALVNCLAVRDFGDCEAIAAVLSDGSLALVSSVEDDLWEETLEEQLEAQPWDRPGEPRLLPQHLRLDSPALEAAAATGAGAVQLATWVAEDRLLLVAGIDSSSSELLVELAVDAANGVAWEIVAIDSGVPPLLTCCSRPAHGGGALLQEHSGALLLYTPGGTLRTLPAAANFPCGCQQMAATPAAVAEQADAAVPPAFGLGTRGQLYWGSRQLAADVTSFAVRRSGPGGAFLLFTTRQHQLHTVSLASLVDGSAAGLLAGVLAAAGQPAAQQAQPQQAAQGFKAAMKAAMRPTGAAATSAAGGVNVRSVEQNALLVAVPPDDVQAVLQMPRGNLEAIKPRSLVLPAVAAALDAENYAEAWELSTINRLDLNVLADYRWPRFLGQADAFVAQVPGDQDIADLLSALDEGSTAAPGGLYAAALPAAAASRGAAGDAQAADEPAGNEQEAAAAADAAGGKVAAVCGAVRAALERSNKARYLRAILTSHAKCGQLEAALTLVQAAKEDELAGRHPEGAPTAEDGLKHLLLFIPDDTLYRAALGMYELELAYMVVAHAQQKDPGEYLLELQRFAELADLHLRHHAIDMHLRRWDSALRDLLAAGDEHFAAALDLAREKGLLRQLLQLQQGKPERLAEAYAAYGDVLEAKGLHEDAGLAFMAAGQTDRAIAAYRSAGQWRMAFALAAKARWPAEQQQRMAAGLAEDLAAVGRAADAAALTLQHLQDVDSAVLLLTQGKEWREALRVAYSNARTDLVDTLVAPQAAQAAASALEDINENIERVAKYGQRLAQLRERRAAMEAALEAAAVESGLPSRQQAEDLFDDTESVADSMISGLSVYTDHTHTGATSMASSSISASTVGGKRRAKKPGKGKSKSGRIRQGSPQEEQQLAEHLLGLAPHSALCAEVGQLAELLVLLGHASDAALLQQRLALLVQQQAAAAADILAHPPPALALALPAPQARALAASAGQAAAAAVASMLAGMPNVALQQRVAAAEAAVREAHWKWDILREPEGGSAAGSGRAS